MLRVLADRAVKKKPVGCPVLRYPNESAQMKTTLGKDWGSKAEPLHISSL